MSRRRDVVVMLLICLLAMTVRLGAIALTVGFDRLAEMEPSSDSRIHIAIVESVLAGEGFSLNGIATAITPPLYVAFLAGIYYIFPQPAIVRILQAALGALASLLVFWIARALVDRTAALAASLVAAVFPHAVYVTGLHLTENLFTVLLLLTLCQSVRVARAPTAGGAALLGALLGLTALTRALFLLFLPCILIWAGVVCGGGNRAARQVRWAATITMIAMLAPWTIRNAIAIGAPVPVQSNSGMIFWAGNNPHTDGGLVWPDDRTWDAGPPPDDGMYGWRALNVGQENSRYISTAARWVLTHPREYLRLLGLKLVRLYGFSRAEDAGTLEVPLPIRLAYGAIIVAAATGMWLSARNWRPLSLLFLLVLFTHATTLLFSGASRYLIPMFPAIAIFGGVAVSRLERFVVRAARLDRVPVGT